MRVKKEVADILDGVDNIISGEVARQYMTAAFILSHNSVVSTLGTNGRTVIHDNNITKDGASVAKQLKVSNPILNTLLSHIKNASIHTDTVAGDGTTTTALYACKLFDIAMEWEREGKSQTNICHDLKSITERIVHEIKRQSVDIIMDSDKLDKVSLKWAVKTTVNGDDKITNLIVDNLGLLNNYNPITLTTAIRVIRGDSDKDLVDIKSGSFYSTGYATSISINDPEMNCVNYNDAMVLMYRGDLTENIEEILPINAAIHPVILFVDNYNDDVVGRVMRKAHSVGLKLTICKLPGFGNERENLIKDITVLTDLQEMEGYDNLYIGAIKSATITSNTCTLVAEDRPAIEEHTKTLLKLIDGFEKDDYDKGKALERYQSFNGKLITISIGGMSEGEINERYHRAYDGLRAAISAIRMGVTVGGGHSMLVAYDNIMRDNDYQYDYLNDAIRSMCFASYETLNNVELDNVRYREAIEHDCNSEVLDSALVTITALESACRLVCMLINTDTIIIEPAIMKNPNLVR